MRSKPTAKRTTSDPDKKETQAPTVPSTVPEPKGHESTEPSATKSNEPTKREPVATKREPTATKRKAVESDSSSTEPSESESDEDWIPDDDQELDENDEDLEADEDQMDLPDLDDCGDCYIYGPSGPNLRDEAFFQEILNQLQKPQLFVFKTPAKTPVKTPRRLRNKTEPVLPPEPKIPTDITEPVKTLSDLIKLAETIDPNSNLEYAFDCTKLKALVGPLKSLQELIGMESIKQHIVEQILMLLSGLYSGNMLHTVLYGPPGSGKTTLALILSSMYQALGYANGTFKTVKRADLVAGYLGQTTIKTQKVIDAAKGGVLFIDEAYSLGDNENRDSFAKEMIDCLTQNLSEQKNNFICIIAGYQKELDRCFFAVNPGLKRRFPFQHTIDRYTGCDLAGILTLMIKQQGWTMDLNNDELGREISMNLKSFNQQGGDIENLIQRCQIAHSARIFGKHQVTKRCLNRSDWTAGFAEFLQHKQCELRKTKSTTKSTKPQHLAEPPETEMIKSCYQDLKRRKII